MDSYNGKAFYCLGQAYGSLNFYDKSIQYYKQALKVVPNNKIIITALKKIERAQKQYLVKERKIYSKMFPS